MLWAHGSHSWERLRLLFSKTNPPSWNSLKQAIEPYSYFNNLFSLTAYYRDEANKFSKNQDEMISSTKKESKASINRIK